MSAKLYCVSANLYIKPERREEFLAIILEDQEKTRTTEPLAKLFLVGESEPNTFHLQEHYVGLEGFEAHKKTPHYEKWHKFASDPNSPFSKTPEAVFFYET